MASANLLAGISDKAKFSNWPSFSYLWNGFSIDPALQGLCSRHTSFLSVWEATTETLQNLFPLPRTWYPSPPLPPDTCLPFLQVSGPEVMSSGTRPISSPTTIASPLGRSYKFTFNIDSLTSISCNRLYAPWEQIILFPLTPFISSTAHDEPMNECVSEWIIVVKIKGHLGRPSTVLQRVQHALKKTEQSPILEHACQCSGGFTGIKHRCV